MTQAASKMKETSQSSFWIGRAIAVLTANADKAKSLVARLATDFPREHEPCPIGSDRALDTAIITAPEARDKKLLKKLDAVAGRVLKKR